MAILVINVLRWCKRRTRSQSTSEGSSVLWQEQGQVEPAAIRKLRNQLATAKTPGIFLGALHLPLLRLLPCGVLTHSSIFKLRSSPHHDGHSGPLQRYREARKRCENTSLSKSNGFSNKQSIASQQGLLSHHSCQPRSQVKSTQRRGVSYSNKFRVARLTLV